MLNSHELADLLLQEVRLLGQSITFQDALDLTPDEKFARAVVQYPLPDRETTASILEEVFWASLLTEESRPCRPRLLYSPRQETMSSAVFRLENPVLLNRDSLRKLAPTQGPLGYLTWDCMSGKPEITGIQGRQGGDPPDLTIASPKNGALDINWFCFRLVTLRAGRLSRLSEASLPDLHTALNHLRQLLGDIAAIFLGTTIGAIASEGHGGAIWILRETRDHRGIQIGHPIYRDDRSLPKKFEQRSKWLESVGHLAAVDGAVLLDSHLRVLGFGAFIDIPDLPREVSFVSSSSNIEKRLSKELGGGRHRSAVEFCSRFAPAAAIVVSEDGRISIIWAAAQDDPYWVPLSILGFGDTIIQSES
jgi:sensor domain DACNV-containing protein